MSPTFDSPLILSSSGTEPCTGITGQTACLAQVAGVTLAACFHGILAVARPWFT